MPATPTLAFRIPRARLRGGNAGVDLDASWPRYVASLEDALRRELPGFAVDVAEGPDCCEVRDHYDANELVALRAAAVADAVRKCGDWIVYY